MKDNKVWNTLSILTKDEIIEFLKSQFIYNLPTKDSIYFFKYNKTYLSLKNKMDAHLSKSGITSEWAKKADELAVKFNNEVDTNKKLEYLQARQKYIVMLQNDQKEWKKIDDAIDKNQKWYDSVKSK